MKARVLSLAALALLACSKPSPTGVAFDRAIREPSGLTPSTHEAQVWWTHPDSGGGNWLWAVDAKGELLARLRVAGGQNIDWEDITSDGTGHLWLGDIGNNESNRRNLKVYRLTEPEPRNAGKSVAVDFALEFYYPEQDTFGDKLADFDSEALFWWSGQLWLLTKHRSNDETRLYRFPAAEPAADGEPLGLEQITSYDLGPTITGERKRWTGQVTAAEVAPDNKHWAMLTYEGVFVFALPESGEGAALFDELVNRVAFDSSYTGQTEALSWDGEVLVVANEDRHVFRIDDPLTRTNYP